MIGALTWNANSTLRQLGVTDGFNSGGTQVCKYGDPVNNIPGYDDLGRLIKVDCGASFWQQNFSYDAFGNLTKSVPTGGTGVAWNPGYNPANNHYTLNGTSYDSAGNLLADTFHTYSWDAEGHPVAIDSSTCGTNGTCLTYDAMGRLAEKNVAGAFTQILYSPVGKLAVMNGQTLVNGYIPLPGGATYNVAPGYARLWHKDWLSTVRLSTTLGNRSVDYDREFAPFGEVYDNFGSTGNKDFTGDTQDTIAGTFDTPKRELNPNQGRWLSPDPSELSAVDTANPQSWNAYAYGNNNPLSFADPGGERPCAPEDSACVIAPPPADVDTTSSIIHDLQIRALNDILNNLRESLQNATQALHTFITSPRDPGCMAAMTVAGAGAGSLLGAKAGFTGGFVIGGLGGTAVEPGGGTALGAWGGGSAGAAGGAIAVGTLGAAGGRAIGWAMCATGGGSGGGGSAGSTGRTDPANLKEQLAMEQAKSNPNAGTVITRLEMADPRWQGG